MDIRIKGYEGRYKEVQLLYIYIWVLGMLRSHRMENKVNVLDRGITKH